MGDLISREAIVKILTRLAVTGPKSHMRAYARCVSEIECAPTVDAEPVRRGEWVDGRSVSGAPWKVCSRCGGYAHTPKGGDPFCHNCGSNNK